MYRPAGLLKATRGEVVFALLRLWAWADDHVVADLVGPDDPAVFELLRRPKTA